MQRLEFSGAVRPIYGSLGVKGLREEDAWAYLKTCNLMHKYFTWMNISIEGMSKWRSKPPGMLQYVTVFIFRDMCSKKCVHILEYFQESCDVSKHVA